MTIVEVDLNGHIRVAHAKWNIKSHDMKIVIENRKEKNSVKENRKTLPDMV